MISLDPPTLLSAYAVGMFPMADEAGKLMWLAPDPRAVLELDRLVISRSLRAAVSQGRFDVTFNRDFAGVADACADRLEGTWISPEIAAAYERLHALGFAHSIECRRGGRLVGGLYGVAMGGAFFGESMFHRETDASKVALVHLVQRLRERQFELLDVQFLTEHLVRLGAMEIPRRTYNRRLSAALAKARSFDNSRLATGGSAVQTG